MNKIVVIGGGFGGIGVLQTLLKYIKKDRNQYKIILISQSDRFVFTPLLHEVSIGVDIESVSLSLNEFCKKHNVEYIQETVTSVDNVNKKVLTSSKQSIGYDYLVVGTGAITQDYNIPGVKEFAFPMKSLHEAESIYLHILKSLKEANLLPKNSRRRKTVLNFSVIGAGPTGIEFIGVLNKFLKKLLKGKEWNICYEEITINLINDKTVFLPDNHRFLGEWIHKYLKRTNICLYLGKRVTAIKADMIIFDDGSHVCTATTVWVAGVKPNTLNGNLSFELDEFNKVIVNDYLQVKGNENVYAVGDIVSGELMLAQSAVQQADVIAKNLIQQIKGKKKYKKFVFKNKGFLVTISKWQAVGELFGVPLKGPLLWLMWHGVYGMKWFSLKLDWKIFWNRIEAILK